MSKEREIVHGTCVALGGDAALLRGGSGAGKSDLALRFIMLPVSGDLKPMLVADDQVELEPNDAGELIARCPQAIAGKLEVHGIGIVELPYLAEARLVLAVDLVSAEDVERMPQSEQTVIAGVAVSRLMLAAFEASAPHKLKLALLQAAGKTHGAWS